MKRFVRAASVVATVLVCAASGAAQLYLRGRDQPDQRVVVGVDAQGVRLSDGQTVVTWDRVRTVKGEMAVAAGPYMEAAEKLWRARMRVQRGDFAGAEPLLEALEPDAISGKGLGGPSAAVLMECLLRCRLARGAQAGATRSMIELLRLGGSVSGDAGEASASLSTGAEATGAVAKSLLDPVTGLVPGLPPMYVQGDAALARTSAEIEQAGTTGLAKLYATAMQVDAGQEVRWTSELGAGVPQRAWIVMEIVQARTGDVHERAGARGALQARLSTPEIPGWMAAWCHVGIGRSLVREADAGDQRRGVLHLLHAPALHGRSSPALASLALAEAAAAMDALGEPDAAEALRVELKERYGRWPAARGVKLKEKTPG